MIPYTSLSSIAAIVLLSLTAADSEDDSPPADRPVMIEAGQQRLSAIDLERALALARSLRAKDPGKTITITLPPGLIRLQRQIDLEAADSGTPGAPLIIQGSASGRTIVSGAVAVPNISRHDGLAEWTTSPELAEALLPHDSGQTGGGAPALYQGDVELGLSSWPSTGYASGWTVTPSRNGAVKLARVGGIPLPNGAVRISGYFDNPWTFVTINAAIADGQLILPKEGSYGLNSGIRLRIGNISGRPSIGRFNIIGTHVVAAPESSGQDFEVSRTPTLLNLFRTSNIVIRNVALEKTSATAIKAVQSSHISFQDCYVGRVGAFGLEVDGGEDVRVSRCVIGTTGLGGVRMNAGERTSLSPGRLVVEDSVIQDVGRRVSSPVAAVTLSGVGNEVRDSIIQESPHMGVMLDGNEHNVENNEIRFSVCETDDAGAVYMGRDWTQRGNRIVGNFIHDVSPDANVLNAYGIYLDDQFSGAEVSGNAVLRSSHGILVGGGRDNHLSGNIFATLARAAIVLDARGAADQKAMTVAGGILRTRLNESPYLTSLWVKRYPSLATILRNRPGQPVGNVARDNIVADGPMIWTFPPTLQFPGTNNLSVNLNSDQGVGMATGSYRSQFRVMTMALRHRAPVRYPGPSRTLAFAGEVHQGSCSRH